MRRLLKGFAILALLGVLGVGALLAGLWLEHRSVLTLPTPTGGFAVGRATYDWAEEGTVDLLAPVPGARREVFVWIWYPSEPGPSAGKVEEYLPAPMRTAAESAAGNRSFLGWVMTGLLTRDVSKVIPHSVRDVAVSPQQPSYPVVIMRGGASAGVMNYSTLAEDLASHGYIVVGVDAPYRTGLVVFPDGRVISRSAENNPELCVGTEQQTSCMERLLNAWTADIGFVLDRLERLNGSDPSSKFAGRLDLARVGVFGHSFGGAQAAQFCHADARCMAGVNVDGRPFGSVIQAGMDKPFMFLLSDHGDTSSDPEARQIEADIQSIYDRLPQERRLMVAIRGANHFTFSDDGALLKSRLVRGAMRLFGVLGIDGRRQLAVTTYCLDRFFDAYLKGEPVPRLDIASPQFPEIQVLR
jgi:predicted dienelactone hydrolase